ncbi:hypothetical protein A2865_00545 [Candidatus Woesebacteria bacterium RIFCSPHIGHO2_01_FULL_39_17]|uniref:Glycosyltransferase RgtA/B/C/D-like domain-containing protein n=2 Tax=Candidatus Woeseibacteriota TaxID=1752722 RepID=A0A0G0RKA0_9BACT|nr:MAG: hypothetical protein US72_C0001G0072 [Microgenomates group bacterium GW2011_GWC1_38_12]KKR14077.1 MAG: hypothetical protein UT40_C0005G0006 [Candidatus Woesebacteria bacterium GW2011_GWA1_39_21b]OGM23676.1 MAG: hypothetical protein A2865_00545 [Candidatus Woesebacteria bacterium RIFCSPHIGHO2_01_FULL_39_17]OGM64707.1 MAG: hypothetical protein A3A52_04365 [Candidatus Woesebacteria bacterium RIFCSPLOWO2_01_FULL_39_14]
MKNFLEKLHTPVWLFILLCLVFILRIPSFFEPYSYGDEMIYLTLGEAIRSGIPLYSEVHDNKPPLLYIMAAIAGNLFWYKAILTLWVLVTIFVFWKLSETLFPKKLKAQQVATAIFALLTTIPLLEGNIVNAELFMIGPTILAFYLLLNKNLTRKNLFFSGVLFSISTLFKVPAIFDFPVIIFIWIAKEKGLNKKVLSEIGRKTLILGLGFLSPIALTIIWFWFKGALNEYLVAAFLQNVGYLSSFRPGDVQKPFLVKNAPLLLRAGVVFVGILILYIKKKRVSREFLFASSWLFLSLFAVTLSERPYPHYLIQSVAPLALLLSILFTYQKKEQVLAILPLTLTFLVPFYFKFWYYPTYPYYARFLKLTSRQISKDEYLATFGNHVPRNYKIADFIISLTKPYEKIFVWGESSPIYALSRRFPPGKYVADYHIKDFSNAEETIKTLSSDLPSFIIILPESSSFPELEFFLRKNYGLAETIDGVEIWKLLNPKVRSLISS